MQEICLTASLAGGSRNFLFCALKPINKLRKDGASSSVWKVALSKSMSLEKKTYVVSHKRGSTHANELDVWC